MIRKSIISITYVIASLGLRRAQQAMFLILKTTNLSFQSRDEGKDYPSLEEARKAAVASSVDIARGEMAKGQDSISVLAELLETSGVVPARLVVTLSAVDLIPDR